MLNRHAMKRSMLSLALCVPATVLAQQQGGTLGGAGGAAGGNRQAASTNRGEAGAVDSSAGSSDQIVRDFGDSGIVGQRGTERGFVGNQNATQGGGTQAPTNFQNLNRQRAVQSEPTGNPIRARLVIGFKQLSAFAGSPTPRVTTAASRAVQRVAPGVTVEVSTEGVATLIGTAETERDRRLAEALVRLEPGVRRVDNQLSLNPVAPPLP